MQTVHMNSGHVLYCTILYYTVLYCTILNYTELYYTELYTLHCTVYIYSTTTIYTGACYFANSTH